MNRRSIKIIISVFILFFIAFLFTVRLAEFQTDSSVYSSGFCDVVQNSKRYDGKKIRINAAYKQGYESSFLTDPNCADSIAVTCSAGKETCGRLFGLLSEKSQVKTVTGIYYDSKYAQDEGYVHQIDISEAAER